MDVAPQLLLRVIFFFFFLLNENLILRLDGGPPRIIYEEGKEGKREPLMELTS